MSNPKFYVNNKQLLVEIHKSKKSYCYFVEPEHANFDVIVSDRAEITPELIEEARQRKAKPRGQPAVDVATIPADSIVVRVMTDEHIPVIPGRSRKLGALAIFPPFKHYVQTADGLKEVCRSHWTGGFENGEFCQTQGRMTHHLGRMLLEVVERYGRRPNFRGYTYLDEMKGNALMQLAQVGLKFNESKSNNPFAFYTQCIKNCFVKVLNAEKRVQNIRDDVLEAHGHKGSFSRQMANDAGRAL